jgi:glycosyltransferase involved in cell wall biosynthesis
LIYWVSERDSGQSNAINKGLKKATGEIVAWLNSDDLYFPNTLNTVAKIFSENPDVDLIYGDVINFYEGSKKTEYHTNQFEPYDFLSRVSIHQPAVFWRKKILAQTGYLDESLYYLMDYDLWMRIFFSYKTMKVNKPLAKFRIHHTSKTSSNPKGLYLEYRKILSRFFNSMDEENIIAQLRNLGIYSNDENKKYNIKANPAHRLCAEQKALNIYIHQCAVQEYSWKNIKKANALFLASLNEPSVLTNLFFLLKNNLGIKYLLP